MNGNVPIAGSICNHQGLTEDLSKSAQVGELL